MQSLRLQTWEEVFKKENFKQNRKILKGNYYDRNVRTQNNGI